MSESKFQPAPEDVEFLEKLSKKSEIQLKQNEMLYDDHLNFFRGVYASYRANAEHDPYAVEDMVDQLKNLLVQGDNPPEKERAMRDFLREIGAVKE
jgi:hypothetical protein